MRVLFDVALLRAHLSELEIVTAQEKGWERLANGRLPSAAQAEFDLLLTVDRGMRHQQPAHTFDIGLVTVRVVGNNVRYFLPLLDGIRPPYKDRGRGRWSWLELGW